MTRIAFQEPQHLSLSISGLFSIFKSRRGGTRLNYWSCEALIWISISIASIGLWREALFSLEGRETNFETHIPPLPGGQFVPAGLIIRLSIITIRQRCDVFRRLLRVPECLNSREVKRHDFRDSPRAEVYIINWRHRWTRSRSYVKIFFPFSFFLQSTRWMPWRSPALRYRCVSSI